MTPLPTVAYDANGNTLTDAQGRTFTWDVENRLTQVVNPGMGTTNFKYDPFGRRIQKFGPLGTTTHVYDRGNVLSEVDNAGSVLAWYTQGLMVDQPLSEFRLGTGNYYHADGLGSVTSLSNGVGAIARNYSFDSFGNVSASVGTITNPFQYTGRESDQETGGLYYYRARYYEAAIGRFLGEDPLRLRQGPNYYVYVNNNPVDLIDPTGLVPCCDPFRERADIERETENARNRLRHLRQFGTAVLPTDTVANVGAMTGCLSGTHVVGTNITFPSQYIMDFRHDPNKQPCIYKCDFVHESVHAGQCMTFGSRFYTLSERETEIPAYTMELGCYLRMQYENNLGPYAK